MKHVIPQSPRLSHIVSVSKGQFHKVAYADWGAPKSPLTICLHGLTRQGRDFDFLARHLSARGKRVVCPDLVGRGASDWLRDPSDYDVEQYVTDMAMLMATLQVNEVDWVGTSLGGLVGIVMAGRFNTPIRRLVVNDIGPRLQTTAVFRIAENVSSTPKSFSSIVEAEQHYRRILAPFGPLADDQWRHLAEHSVKHAPDGRLVPNFDPQLSKGFRLPVTYEAGFWSSWENIRCPILVLRGENSDLLARSTLLEMAKRNARTTIVEIPNVGHAPALADEDQHQLISSWLDMSTKGTSAQS